MSYLDDISEQERSILTEFPSFGEYLEHEIDEFERNSVGSLSDYTLKIENIIFLGGSEFVGNLQCSIEFINCYFLRDALFYNLKVLSKISFRQCFFDGEFCITKSAEFKNDFHLIEVSIRRQLYVEGGIFNDCKWSILDNAIVKINGGYFSSLNIGYWGAKSILKQLSFDFTRMQGSISVTGNKSEIHRLDLSHYASDLSISIEDICVNSINIYQFRNEKSFRLSNLKALPSSTPSEFSVVESYLGKAEFYSIDFSSFNFLKLLDSHLVDCSFINIKWPSKIYALKGRYLFQTDDEKNLQCKVDRLEDGKYENTSEKDRLESDKQVIRYYEKKREVLRQLKYSLSKQGDVVNEQKFHSQEMRAYEKVLSYDGDFWTKYIIKFSYCFSDFGQSMSRPIIGLLGIHAILFSILVLFGALAPLHFSIDDPTSHGFWKGIYEYVRLLSPLRKAEDTFQGGFILIDVFIRLWASYMIYNIIRASRRFIK